MSPSKGNKIEIYKLSDKISDSVCQDSDTKRGSGLICLSVLPQEIILEIISNFEPNSTSFISLAKVNRSLNSLMARVGNNLIQCARKNFTYLLPKLDYKESNISLFIRHVQAAEMIQMKCKELRIIMNMDFEYTDPYLYMQSMNDCRKENCVTTSCIDKALSLATDLIACDSLSYFLADGRFRFDQIDLKVVRSKRKNLYKHCPASIRCKILSLVRLCCIQVYTYLKRRSMSRLLEFLLKEHIYCCNHLTQFDESEYYKDQFRLSIVRILVRSLHSGSRSFHRNGVDHLFKKSTNHKRFTSTKK